jgi:hypothetical protein
MNPYKQSARAHVAVADFINEPQRCKGYFFDSVNKRTVCIDLGYVTCSFPFRYRAASLTASDLEAVKPFEGEDAAHSELSASEYRPQRSEDGTEEAEISSGTYVIPGQSIPREANAQKIGNKSRGKNAN